MTYRIVPLLQFYSVIFTIHAVPPNGTQWEEAAGLAPVVLAFPTPSGPYSRSVRSHRFALPRLLRTYSTCTTLTLAPF